MKRNNGFIDLNDYFRKIKNTNKWFNYDFLLKGMIAPSLYDDRHYWLTIKGKKYYYKPTNYPYHELLAYFIAMYLQLDAAHYDLAELKNTQGENIKGVISESFRKKNAKYIRGNDILKEYFENCKETVKDMGLTDEWQEYYEGPYFIDMNNLEIIWQALEFCYRNNPDVDIKDLMDRIVEQYMFAILIRANDKGAQNWEIEESDAGVKVCKILDNEISFYDENCTVAFSTDFSDNEKSIGESIKRFLSISSHEYIEKFITYFNYLEVNDLIRIIQGLEHHIKSEIPITIKNEIINNFELNRREIEEVLIELNLISKGR